MQKIYLWNSLVTVSSAIHAWKIINRAQTHIFVINVVLTSAENAWLINIKKITLKIIQMTKSILSL